MKHGVVVLTAALALLLAACGAGPAAPGAPAGGPPAHGGSMTYAYSVETRGLDPARSAATPNNGALQLTAIYDTLVIPDPVTGQARPRLAESLRAEDGGSRWVLTLRPNLTFTDGTPLDAAAVAFNVARHADAATNSLHRSQTAGLAVEVVDPRTVAFRLDRPNLHFDKFLALSPLSFIGSPTAIAADPVRFDTKPVGAGPFTVQEWRRDEQLTLVRNPGYWDAPKPVLDELVVRIIHDQTQGFNSVLTGEVQVMTTAHAPLHERARTSSGVAVETYELGGGLTIAFNSRTAPFDDPRARRAVSLALGKAEMLTVTGGEPARNMFPDSSPFHDPALDFPGDDPAEAQHLFDELAAEGRPLRFATVMPDIQQGRMIAEFVQARLSTYRNVNVEVEILDGVTYQVRTRVRPDYQATVWNLSFSEPEPGLWQQYHTGGMNNVTGYSDPEVDDALDRARTTLDPTERKAAYAAMQRKLNADVPEWFVRTNPNGAIHGDGVTGIVFYGDGRLLLSELGYAENQN